MSLLSAEFFALVVATSFWMLWARGAWRIAGFVALSSVFATSHLLGSGEGFGRYAGIIGTLGFIGLGYLGLKLVDAKPRRLPVVVVMLVAVFVWMRRYDFVGYAIGEDFTTRLFISAGLSFLLFKILHLIVDVAGRASERPSPGMFLAYCLNLTAFLMGPIQRFSDFQAQWVGRECALPATWGAHLDALLRILRGLIKKYVLAELLFKLWIESHGFGPGRDLATMPLHELALAPYAFYLRLYLDFSGYCDVMIGAGSLIGIRPPENFNLPILARDVADFWLRVHRSLTLWLTDYVFTPLRMRTLRSSWFCRWPSLGLAICLMTTMFVSGLWHGTTTAFMLFGLVHGVYLVVHRLYELAMQKRRGRKGLRELRARWSYRLAAWALTFLVTGFAYIFFALSTDELRTLAERFGA
ncbi:MAG: MBOAT family protein [Planctomycetes bacterium]|nr:MBOAT family protein [Planctomycetota bacterium]